MGDFVEVGCHTGGSTVIIKKILKEIDAGRNLYTLNSFNGVPDTDSPDEGVYNKGDMAASLGKFNSDFEKFILKKP